MRAQTLATSYQEFSVTYFLWNMSFTAPLPPPQDGPEPSSSSFSIAQSFSPSTSYLKICILGNSEKRITHTRAVMLGSCEVLILKTFEASGSSRASFFESIQTFKSIQAHKHGLCYSYYTQSCTVMIKCKIWAGRISTPRRCSYN